MFRMVLIVFLTVVNSMATAAEVSFKTADNALIFANFQQRGTHAVLLAHGAIFNKESWGDFEQKMLDENFTVLAIDFRGYNKSTQGDRPQALYEDILAGIAFLAGQPQIKKVTVLGASMGGAAAAKASVYSKSKMIDQLILLSPARIYKPELLKGRLLFIASKGEYLVEKLLSAFSRSPNPKELLLIEGKAHAQHIFNSTETEVLTSSIIKFLKK